MTAAAIVSGAAYKFVAIVNTVDDCYFKGPAQLVCAPVLQVIYRIYFAMPKIPEFAGQHNCCVAKYFGIDACLPVMSSSGVNARSMVMAVKQAEFDRARLAKFPPVARLGFMVLSSAIH